jgi:hypothetical protein
MLKLTFILKFIGKRKRRTCVSNDRPDRQLDHCLRRCLEGHHQARSAEQRYRLQDLLRRCQSLPADGPRGDREVQEGGRSEADQRSR